MYSYVNYSGTSNLLYTQGSLSLHLHICVFVSKHKLRFSPPICTDTHIGAIYVGALGLNLLGIFSGGISPSGIFFDAEQLMGKAIRTVYVPPFQGKSKGWMSRKISWKNFNWWLPGRFHLEVICKHVLVVQKSPLKKTKLMIGVYIIYVASSPAYVLLCFDSLCMEAWFI